MVHFRGIRGVRIGGKWGFIDKQGKWSLTPSLTGAWRFSEGLAAVRIGDEETGKWGYIDKQGKMVIGLLFEPRHRSFLMAWPRYGLARQGEKWGYIDKQGKFVINPQFDSAEPFAEGLAAVRNGDKWGYISR